MVAAFALVADERRQLVADAQHPARGHLARVERPLGGPAAGVADLPGGPADQQQRAVPGALEPAGGDDLHEVTDVQRRGGGIEAHIERDPLAGERLGQRGRVGRILDQSAPGQVV